MNERPLAENIDSLRLKLDKKNTAIGRIEKFTQVISSSEYPDDYPSNFPARFDLRRVDPESVEFGALIDRLDKIENVSIPRSLGLLESGRVSLEGAIKYGQRLQRLELKHRAGRVSDETFTAATSAFEVMAADATRSLHPRVRVEPTVVGEVKVLEEKRPVGYTVREDGVVILWNRRALTQVQAAVFRVLAQRGADRPISPDELAFEIYHERGWMAAAKVGAIVSRLRQNLFGSGFSIPPTLPANLRKPGEIGSYCLEINPKIVPGASPVLETNKEDERPRVKLHVNEEKLAVVEFALDNPYASDDELISQLGPTKKGDRFKKHQAIWALKGVIGLLWFNATQRNMNEAEERTFQKVQRFVHANNMHSKQELQVWIAKRLGA